MTVLRRVLARTLYALPKQMPFFLTMAGIGIALVSLSLLTQARPAAPQTFAEAAVQSFCNDRPNVKECRGDIVTVQKFDTDTSFVVIHLHGVVENRRTQEPTRVHGPILLMVNHDTGEVEEEVYGSPEAE